MTKKCVPQMILRPKDNYYVLALLEDRELNALFYGSELQKVIFTQGRVSALPELAHTRRRQ
jgi:hypothetical protein